jgi:hypothetical protein
MTLNSIQYMVSETSDSSFRLGLSHVTDMKRCGGVTFSAAIAFGLYRYGPTVMVR